MGRGFGSSGTSAIGRLCLRQELNLPPNSFQFHPCCTDEDTEVQKGKPAPGLLPTERSGEHTVGFTWGWALCRTGLGSVRSRGVGKRVRLRGCLWGALCRM